MVAEEVDLTLQDHPDFTLQDHPDFTLQDHPDFTLQDHPDSIPRVELDSIQQVRLDSALLVLPGLGLLVDLSASDRVAFDPWEVPVSTHLERTLPVCGQFPQEADLLGWVTSE